MDIENAPIATETAVTPEVAAPEAVIVENAPVEASVEIAVESPKPTETLLGASEAPKIENIPESTVENPVESTEIKTENQSIEQESNQSDEPASLPTYEEFIAPEGLDLDAERVGDFTSVLAEFESKTKADHAEVQAFGQQLIERFATEVNRFKENYDNTLQEAFDNQKNSWKEAFENDPEIGGNRKDTTMKLVIDGLGAYGGTPEQLTEFRTTMENTGVGNNPAQIRVLSNLIGEITRLKDKYESESSVKMLSGNAPAPQLQNKIQRRYGTN